MLRELLSQRFPAVAQAQAAYADFRPGDVRHSQADISKACRLLGYAPTHDVRAGLEEALAWYVEHFSRRGSADGAGTRMAAP
ncbi:MAG: hypothetical protein IRY96_00785 [Burkholderiales bacterium]|nr:hypothetical protein [Burkholderiales bacterium]